MTEGTALVARAAEQRAALLAPESSSPQWVLSSMSALTQDRPPRLPERSALTTDQRRAVQEMSSRLAGHLSPASVEEIATAFAMLRAQFPAADMDDGQARAVSRGFLIALEGTPAFALEEAVARVLKGKAGLHAGFMPTAPQFRQLVDEISRPARWHTVQLQRLLAAKVEREVSDDERARVAARFKGIVWTGEDPGANTNDGRP